MGFRASHYDKRPNHRIKSCYWNSIRTTNRKAPAFLQGLLSLVRYGAEDEDRTRAPLLGILAVTASRSDSHAPFRGNDDYPSST